MAISIDENTIIGDILDSVGACEAVFRELGLHCVSCPAARGETLREACEIHEIDVALLLERLRRVMNQ